MKNKHLEIQKLVAELILAARQGKTGLTNIYSSKFNAIIAEALHQQVLEQIAHMQGLTSSNNNTELATPDMAGIEQWLAELRQEPKLLKIVDQKNTEKSEKKIA